MKFRIQNSEFRIQKKTLSPPLSRCYLERGKGRPV